MDKPTVSISVDVQTHSWETREWVTFTKDVLMEGPSAVEVAKKLAKWMQATSKRRFFPLQDMRFHVTRLNPDTSGSMSNDPLFTTVILDSEEALRGVGMVFTMLVNEFLRKTK